MPLAKLYTNSLMSTLNSRRKLKAAGNNGSESHGHSVQRSGVNVNVLRGERGGRKNIVVRAFLSNPLHLFPSNRIKLLLSFRKHDS